MASGSGSFNWHAPISSSTILPVGDAHAPADAGNAQGEQHQVLHVNDVRFERLEHALERALCPRIRKGLAEALVLQVVHHHVALEAVDISLEQRVGASREDLLAAEDLDLVASLLQLPSQVVGVDLRPGRMVGQEEVHRHQDLHGFLRA